MGSNRDGDAQAKLLAAALYEVRLLLGPGSQRPDEKPENQAAALAYGLHNEALALLEGRDFDMDEVWRRLAGIDKRLGTEAHDRLRFHIDESARRGARDPLDSASRNKQTEIRDFATAARTFCELIESGTPEGIRLAKGMSALHSAALELPNVEAEADAPEPSAPAPLENLSLPLDIYWDVFDPFAFETPPKQPGAGSFYDDIADIRLDLRRGLDLYDSGFPLAACWAWRFDFQFHWGAHLVGAQRALHLWMRR
jgi:hypothetical protein